MDTTITKPNKKSLQYLAIIIVIAILVCIGLFYLISKIPEIKEEKAAGKTMEEVIRSLSAPQGAVEPISIEVQKSISASSVKKGQGEVSEDIIKSLSAPE